MDNVKSSGRSWHFIFVLQPPHWLSQSNTMLVLVKVWGKMMAEALLCWGIHICFILWRVSQMKISPNKSIFYFAIILVYKTLNVSGIHLYISSKCTPLHHVHHQSSNMFDKCLLEPGVGTWRVSSTRFSRLWVSWIRLLWYSLAH